jgi:glycogen debranching enzyme
MSAEAGSRGGTGAAGEVFDAPAQADALIPRATDITGVLVLKHDRRFIMTDAYGDVQRDDRGLGLYVGDTRVLSTYELRLNGQRPVVLRTGAGAGYAATIQLTNPDLLRNPTDKTDPEVVLSRQSLGIVRERVMSDTFSDTIRVDNYTLHPERCTLSLRLDADFADIFEVRGVIRDRRGREEATQVGDHHVTFSYVGLDGLRRRTTLTFSEPLVPAPAYMTSAQAVDAVRAGPLSPARASSGEGTEVLLVFDWTLPPGGHRDLVVHISEDEVPLAARSASDESDAAHRAWFASSASITTKHVYADRAFRRCLADLRLLVNSGPGPGERYVAAGVPWFSTIFGRDAIITALQVLPVRPQVAREHLLILARLQATEVDDRRDAQPGKILHELRTGELANAGEIPHTPYYGTVDATPLWLILLGEYQRWTGDGALVDRLWPNALAALKWIDTYGDLRGDGFLRYERRSPEGLVNQGWKDSADANRFRDGSIAEAPLALVEVQGYVHRARLELARLARLRGDEELAGAQEAAAAALAGRFEERFWMDDVGTYAMALDAHDRQVDAVASNPGHVLWSGIASAERAARVAESLTGDDLFSGWGIRTLAASMAGYNPIGYHIGSIWPHDNAIAAAGLLRYGFREEATRVAVSMLEATMYFRDSRLPELFCGFDRGRSPYPVPYPVACSPQAWAAGSLIQLLAALLGLEPDATDHTLVLQSPSLPDWLPSVYIENMRVGDAVVDLRVRRDDGTAGVEVLRRTGDLSVVVRI